MRGLIIMVILMGVFVLPKTLSGYSYNYDPKPLRICLKIGSPNIAGLEFEYVTPFLQNRIAPYISGMYGVISGYKSSVENGETTEDIRQTINHFGIGSKAYFKNEGRGGYIALGYDRPSYVNKIIKSDKGLKSWTHSLNLLSAKIGYLYLGDIFYYSFEIGYGLNVAYSEPNILDKGPLLFTNDNWPEATFAFGLAF